MPEGGFSQDWPTWLERCRLDDAQAAQAYAVHTDRQRACLKTAIAFQFHLWGESPRREVRGADNPISGFCHTLRHAPLAWAAAVLVPEHRSPARLLAALVPAILAGVERVIILSPGALPSRRNLLALELGGFQDVFVPDADEPGMLLDSPLGSRPGILLTLPTAASPLTNWEHEAAARGIPVWKDAPCPDLGLEFSRRDPEGAQRADLLAWCHGDAAVHDPQRTDRPRLRAVYTAPSFQGLENLDDGQTAFKPGMEGCWVHPDLSPALFRTLTLDAGLCSQDKDRR